MVEASRLARIPMPCTKNKKETPGDCVCPWDVVADCPRGCASEGLSLVVAPERAAARLCAADPSKPVARPAPDAIAPPGVCVGEGNRCLTSLVIACTAGDARLGPEPLACWLPACAGARTTAIRSISTRAMPKEPREFSARPEARNPKELRRRSHRSRVAHFAAREVATGVVGNATDNRVAIGPCRVTRVGSCEVGRRRRGLRSDPDEISPDPGRMPER